MSDQESLFSCAPLTPPSGLLTRPSGPSSSSGYNSIVITAGERSSPESILRLSNNRESTSGDLNLSDGPYDNGSCITADPDNISLVSSHHNMYQCNLKNQFFF